MILARASRLRPLAALLAAVTLWTSGCSLGNVAQDDCASTDECVAAFGEGSACVDGYCTDVIECVTGQDCRALFGGGACVNGECRPTLPTDSACPLFEPEDLYDRPATGDDARVILGGIFSLEEGFDQNLTKAVRLAIREINRSGKGIGGKEYGIVFCDNGGPNNDTEGAEREALNTHALDYLAGTLGVSAIVGPLSSRDATTLIGHEVKKGYPSVIISPSATSPSLSAPIDKLAETDPLGMFWRTCPSDELQGAVLGKYVLGMDLAIQNATVLYLQDPYGEGLATVFAAEFPGNTELVPFQPFTPGDDLSSYVQQVAATNPDAILVIAVQGADTVALLEAMSTVPALQTTKFFFTDGSKDEGTLLNMDLPDLVKAMIQGSKGTAPAKPEGPNYTLFASNLAADFDLVADQTAFLAQSYDATYLAAYGTLYAESVDTAYDGRLVAEGLSRMISELPEVNIAPTDWTKGKAAITSGDRQFNVFGTSGDLEFDPEVGEAPAPIEIWSVDDNLSGFITDEIITDP
jgi:ABC-type branched-subunit amino acid transport system substrate-binding protein